MKAAAIFNLKGGVGKTSCAVNLALFASMSGQKVVLWDLDAQAAATWLLSGEGATGSIKKAVKSPVAITGSIGHTPYPRLDLIPASFSNRKLDALLSGSKAFTGIVQVLAQRYDLLIIDAPPSLARLADNIFRISDVVLAPVIPSPLAVRAFDQLRQYVEKQKNPPVLRAFLSMVDRRRKQHEEWLIDAPEALRGVLFRNYIPYSSAVERMSIEGVPLLSAQPGHPVAKRYVGLWDELAAVLKQAGPSRQ